MNIEVLSRGESRHEIVSVQVEQKDRGGLSLESFAKTGVYIALHDQGEIFPDAMKVLSIEEIPDEGQGFTQAVVTLALFWRLGEDPS